MVKRFLKGLFVSSLLGLPVTFALADNLVEVAPVSVGPLQEIREYVGTIVSSQRSSLSAQIAGRIDQVMVDVGSAVVARDPLVQLNDDLAKLEVQRTLAAVAQRQAELNERQRLVEDGQQLRAREILPDSELKARIAARDIARATLQSAQADLALAEKRLAQHTVLAPFDGAVVAKEREVGEWVVPGTGLLQVVRLGELWLDVQIPQDMWPVIKDLSSAVAQVDAIPGARINLRKLASAPASRVETRTFLTRFAFTQVDDRLAPGMSARVDVAFDIGESILAVPRDAIVRRPDNSIIVWVVVPSENGSIVEERLISVGVATRDHVVVRSGLTADDVVVVRGNENLRAGQTVLVSEG